MFGDGCKALLSESTRMLAESRVARQQTMTLAEEAVEGWRQTTELLRIRTECLLDVRRLVEGHPNQKLILDRIDAALAPLKKEAVPE